LARYPLACVMAIAASESRGPMARLIVVRGRERECFEPLTQEFATDPGVRGIWDRRAAGRRGLRSCVSTERREDERRALLAEGWTALRCVVGCERLMERVEDPNTV
jgi:hypothetical protein